MLILVLELTRHIKCLMSNIVFATGVQKIALGPKMSPQDLEPLVIEDKTCKCTRRNIVFDIGGRKLSVKIFPWR